MAAVLTEKGYNPDQPRDDRGRFGEGAGDLTKPHEIESTERFEAKSERGYLIDPKTGAAREIGKPVSDNSIEVSEKECEQARGMIYTHNHPGGDSFSKSDHGFSAHAQVAEMRAFGVRQDGAKYLYRLRPAEGSGWPSEEAMRSNFSKSQNALKAAIRRPNAPKNWIQDWQHLINVGAAERGGLRYERIKL